MRILCLLMLLLLCPFAAFSADVAGTVKMLTGEVLLDRQGQSFVVVVGMPIYVEDRLLTMKDSSVGLILQDDTTLSIGPGSELLVKDFIFEPKQNRFSLVLKMFKGTFLYMSGVIGKLAPESIRLETPDSTIAVRGTRLLVKVSP